MSSETSSQGITWDLKDLFCSADDPSIMQTLDECAAQAATFASTYRGTIQTPETVTATHMRTALEQLETLHDAMAKPAIYASLLFAADTSKPEHRDLQVHVEQCITAIANNLIFFDLEWMALHDEDVQRLLDDPLLVPYRHYLTSLRRYKPHTLTEAEEKIVNEKDVTGVQAWRRFFTELNASLSIPIERNGTTECVTMDTALSLMRKSDRALREQSHTKFFEVLGTQVQTRAYIYNTLLQDHQTMDRLRTYPDPMAQRHLSNEVAPETVDTMMRVVEENVDIAHMYFALKARLLNLPHLEIYDQYAPIGENPVHKTYDEAQRIILEAFGTFSTQFRDVAALFFDNNWIDAEVRPAKQGGAFCQGGTPTTHPYVLCNYTDDLRDVMTVAHELGHGIHFYLARKQTWFNFCATLPLLETASVFGEMLVFEHILQQQQDAKVKLSLLCAKIEDMFATVFRQTVLTRFEQAAFAGRAKSLLTPEQLSDYWTEANARYYGHAVQMTKGYELGWSYIPHFVYTPFYCYSYVFGELLVLALHSLYREQGEAFVPRYIALLESGVNQTPDEQLAPLGIDTRDPSFWQRGFDEVRRLVAMAQSLV